MKKLLISILATLLLAGAYGVAAADTGPVVEESSYQVDSAKQIVFRLGASSTAEIEEIQLVVRFPNGISTRLIPEFTPGTSVETEARWILDNTQNSAEGGYLPPGTEGEYGWEIKDAAGNQTNTNFKPFVVEDNRFDWQVLENDRFAVYWYAGGERFGEAMFERLNETIDQIEQVIGAELKNKIKVFVYADSDAFNSILSPGHSEFTGATPVHEHNIMLVKSAPSDLDFALVAGPHELIHMVISQQLGTGFGQVAMPLWMNEGLASYYEYDPPLMEGRYVEVFDQAIVSDKLLRLRNFANTRPSDYDENLLMYAQGFSVVEFILKNYGSDKMSEIFAEFKKGSADQAFQTVLGVDQDGLENLWRESLGIEARTYSSVGIATPRPVPTFAFSGVETAVTSTEPTATRQAVAAANTPAPAAVTAAPQSSNTNNSGAASTGLCGIGGGLALAMFGAYEWRRRRKSIKL